MTAQPPTTNTLDPDDALLVIQQRASALIDPALIGEDINMRLERLYEDGADPAVIDAIADNAADLVDQAHTLGDHLGTLAEAARTLRSQREEARQKLADLKRALDEMDTDVEEVESFYEYVEEMLMEQLWDIQYENLGWEIASSSGLNFEQSWQLIELLTGGDLRGDHPLWRELGEWLSFARREAGLA